MLTLPLEPTDDRANPAFKNATACAKWLAQMQFTNLQMSHATLRKQLDEFNRFPISSLERLQTQEVIRETVHHVQADFAKKLAGRPVPLSDIEMSTLASINGLWQAMLRGYQRCLQDYQSGDKQLAHFGALLCHRCLLYVGLQIFEHLRVGYEFDGQLWQQLHAIYAFSEEHGLLLATVNDEQSDSDPTTSCRSLYIKILLACHAHPEELSRTQQQWMNRWLSLWTPTLSLEHTYSTYAVSKGDAPTLALDLDSSLGLQSINSELQGGGNLRYLPMVPMSKLLRVKIILLQQGQSPQQLDLGDGGNTFDCSELLNHLHKCWCEPPVDRSAERSASAQEMLVCYGLEGAYSYVANKPFSTSKKNALSSDAARKQIETLGRTLSESAKSLAAVGYPQESYKVEDESILGARLLRLEKSEDIRLSANQIVGTLTTSAKSYSVGVTVWVNVKRTGQLHMGIRYLPGIPEPITVKKKVAAPDAPNPLAAALLLPAIPNLSIPSSLLIPRNLFQAGTVLEITLPDNKKMNAKLRFSVERGMDYERVSFEPL